MQTVSQHPVKYKHHKPFADIQQQQLPSMKRKHLFSHKRIQKVFKKAPSQNRFYLILHELGVTAIDLHLFHLLLPLLSTESPVWLQHLYLVLQVSQAALQRAYLRVLKRSDVMFIPLDKRRKRLWPESILCALKWQLMFSCITFIFINTKHHSGISLKSLKLK